MSSLRTALALLTMTVLTASATTAHADEPCPLGSTERREADLTWCEPSICDADISCPKGSVCRLVPLCVEIGAVDGGGEAGGARLLVRQRCGLNKACPQNTTCSEKSRCITLAQADKAGLTTLSPNASATPTITTTDAPPKKACGCDVPGSSRTTGGAGVVLALAGVVAISARRRARRSA